MIEQDVTFVDLDSDDFISGKTVDLRLPDIENDIIKGCWHAWFNNPEVTKYLIHGVFPIDRNGEAALIRDEMNKKSSLILCVIQKETNAHLGVISLKHIDLLNRTAEIGIVMGPGRNPTAAFEAMSLLIKHAFERINLNLLYAGQHQALWKWVNQLSLIGFKIDGYRKHAGYRNGKPYGVFLTSVFSNDFFELQKLRKGNILTDNPLDLLSKRNKQNPLGKLDEIIRDLNKRWYGI